MSYDTVHDVRLAWRVLNEIVHSGFFEIVGGKGFDSSEVMMYIDEHGLVPCIDVRGGMLEPRSGIRLFSRMNYGALRSERGNVRALVESLFSSVKALGRGFVRSHLLEGAETEISVMFLAYNVAVLVKLEERSKALIALPVVS